MAPPSLPKASQSLQKPPKVSPKTPQRLPKVSPKLPRLPPEVSPGYGRVPRGSQRQKEGKKRKTCQKVPGGDSIFSCLGRARTVLKKQTVLRNGFLPPPDPPSLMGLDARHLLFGLKVQSVLSSSKMPKGLKQTPKSQFSLGVVLAPVSTHFSFVF